MERRTIHVQYVHAVHKVHLVHFPRHKKKMPEECSG